MVCFTCGWFFKLFQLMGNKECFLTFRPPDEEKDKGINFSELVSSIGTQIFSRDQIGDQRTSSFFETWDSENSAKILNQNMVTNRSYMCSFLNKINVVEKRKFLAIQRHHFCWKRWGTRFMAVYFAFLRALKIKLTTGQVHIWCKRKNIRTYCKKYVKYISTYTRVVENIHHDFKTS